MKYFIFSLQNMNTNMNTLVCNMQYYKVLQLETRTENPCVGGSIPPLGTIIKELDLNKIKQKWTSYNFKGSLNPNKRIR